MRECSTPPHAASTRHTAGPAMAIKPGLITPADVTTAYADPSAVDHLHAADAG
jgi:hypothetical protein